MSLPHSLDDGGSPIIQHELYVDQGDDFSSQFEKIVSFDGHSLVFTTDSENDGLVTGKTYRFKTLATNRYGASDFSFEMIVGLGAKSAAPGQVQRDTSFQSEFSIRVKWTPAATNDLEVTGYVLEMDDGYGGPFTEIYDGRENTQTFNYEVVGL